MQSIIAAACVLHNIGLLHKVVFDDNDSDSDNDGDSETDDEDAPTKESAQRRLAKEKRNEIAENF